MVSEHRVELFVYDLTQGLARQLSPALLGQQIDGVWHSAIVAWGREIFFGHGISIVAPPGTTHLGKPYQVHQLGETSVDWDMFQDILADLRPRYRVEDYDLLRYNCNDFSSELAQILTGQELPEYVQTRAQTEAVARSPIGAQLLSQFAGPRGAPAGAQQPASGSLNALMGDLAARATEPEASDTAADDPATHGIENITTAAQLTQLQQKSACAAVLFTSSTCPPCRIVDPIFEELASAYHPSALTSANPNTKRMRFARVSCDSLGAQEVMAAAQVTATPTLLTYTFGRRAGQVRGADVAEMRTQVDLALFEVYPPHPHASHRLSSRASLPQQPVRVANMPDFARLLGKIDEAAAALPADAAARIADARRTLADSMVPYLAQEKRGRITADEVRRWDRALETYLDHSVHLAPLFPLVDLWRIATLDTHIVQHLAADRTQQGTSVDRLAKRASDELTGGAPAPAPAPASTRALWLTSLRLLANALAAIPPGAPAPILSTPTALSTEDRSAGASTVATLLSEALLHPEDGVRAVAAATAFNAACSLAAGRVDWMRRISAQETAPPSAALADYETQLVCALTEALKKETASHTTAFRLAAALLLILYKSPCWESQLRPTLEVLETGAVLAEVQGRTWPGTPPDAALANVLIDLRAMAPKGM